MNINTKKPDSGVRLYIGGFPRRTTKSELEEFCSRYGKVKGEIDLIPNKQFAFVTFNSKAEATLAMFAIQQELFKGTRLNVDWAKQRQDEKDSAKTVPGPAPHAKSPRKGDEQKPSGAKQINNTQRYIPGDMKEIVESSTSQVNSHQPVTGAEPEIPNKEIPPEPELPAPVPIPNLITKTHYPESNPPLEVTIRDTQSHDIKYTFRVKSLSTLKNYLLQEASGEVNTSDLFHTSSQKDKINEKKNISYGSIPVVHIYQDLLGKEMLEPLENKDDREYLLRKKNFNNLKELPPAKVPLSSKKIPVEEIYHLLVSKSYEYVLLNTSANGPSAPLHPEWRPLPHTYSFRKGNQLVMFYGNTVVESFQFLLPSTNQSYRDLLPILLKYKAGIFNSIKGAFITPQQLQ